MIQEFLKPLDQQFDSGFGATADSFHDAAKAALSREAFGISRSQLPILFLYRHACELYLKSICTLLFRRFLPAYPQVNQSEFPLISVGKKNKKIFQVHSIKTLFLAYKALLHQHLPQLKDICETNWGDLPQEWHEYVEIIENADQPSTSFRYPMTLNQEIDVAKSPFKEANVDSLFESKKANEASTITLALKNENNQILKAYQHDSESLSEILDSLKSFAESLSGVNFGLSHELLS